MPGARAAALAHRAKTWKQIATDMLVMIVGTASALSAMALGQYLLGIIR
jgi:hypothetical protein